MSTLLHREISRLEKQMLVISTLAEENVHKAIKAVEERDPEGVTRAISKAVTRIVRDSTPKIAEVARSVASGGM